MLGLEAAYALHKLGLHVVLESAVSLLTRQLNRKGGEYLQGYLRNLWLDIVTEDEVHHIVEQEGRVNGIALKDGRHLSCD